MAHAPAPARGLVRYWTEGSGLERWRDKPRPFAALTRELRRSGVSAARTPTLAANIYRVAAHRSPPRRSAAVPPEGATAEVIAAALVAALLAGATQATAAAILARLPGVPDLDVARAITSELSWTELSRDARRTARPGGDTVGDRIVREAAIHNVERKARYLLAAAGRLAPAFVAGDAEKLAAARRAEGRYWDAHRAAERGRKQAARRIAENARYTTPTETGEVLLGWRATLDAKTSADCRAADGRNFDALKVPRIGYPGTVHPGCRCTAVIAYDTQDRVEKMKVDHGSV